MLDMVIFGIFLHGLKRFDSNCALDKNKFGAIAATPENCTGDSPAYQKKGVLCDPGRA
jgi:hypothetical protein